MIRADVLNAVIASPTPLTSTEIAKQLNIPASSVKVALHKLHANGKVTRELKDQSLVKGPRKIYIYRAAA